MKPSNLIDAQRIIGLIEAGTASQSDVVALLIYLREHLTDHDPIKDIAHCIAHTQRNRGVAFAYIDRFVGHFIDIVQHGGRLIVPVLFPLAAVTEQLIGDLQRHGLAVQPEPFRRQSALLQRHFGDILDGVTIQLSNPLVIECGFATAHSNPAPCFYVRFRGLENGKALQLPANVAMAFPVLVG